MACLLGIEADTTNVKAALVDDQTGVLTRAAVECPVPGHTNGRVEIDNERKV
ncbi:MAG: hypothetical protein HQ523_08885 [Lentisphaerae bacterium]|nr:hypothetical protein [Lentisphaerota bacterium]